MKILPFFQKTALLCSVLVFFSFTNLGQNDWQLAKEQSGIKVFTRSGKAEMKEYRGEAVIEAPVEEVFAVLNKFDEYSTWMPSCLENKIIKRVSDAEFYQYNVTDAPWPVSDRDSVMKTKITKQASGVITIELTAVPDYIPEKKGRIRVPTFKGLWKLTPKNGKTEVIYEGKPSTGGNIPTWLANSSVVDIPLNTLTNLKSLVIGK
ncbi:MAG TPA: START domain-containing protein [Chitinophagales bacterium]|nr:START domain-containing protein [Chitinophagales bacterium]HRK28012.1 START domain-containing protein [Chitinophagales bacterium]